MKSLVLCLSVFAAASPASAGILPEIKNEIEVAQPVLSAVPLESKKRVVVFDIDDTLSISAYRSKAIFREIGKERAIPQLETIEIGQIGQTCRATMENAGVTDKPVVNSICSMPNGIWARRFFKDPKYLKFDGRVKGGADMVQRLVQQAVADVVFLTERPEALRKATEQQLARLAMPGFNGDKYPGVEFRVVMRPEGRDTEGDAAQWKASVIESMLGDFIVAGVFDDSISAVNAMRHVLPSQVPVVRLAQNVNDTAGVDMGVEQITDYTRNMVADTQTGQMFALPNKRYINSLVTRIQQVDEY